MKIDLDISFWQHLLNLLSHKENGGVKGHLYRNLKFGIENATLKEINYKNYGKIDELNVAGHKLSKWGCKTTENHNYLERDERGHFLPIYKKIYHFKYNSPNTGIKNREIELVKKDDFCIIGKDRQTHNYQVKNFRRDRIIGRVKIEKIKI